MFLKNISTSVSGIHVKSREQRIDNEISKKYPLFLLVFTKSQQKQAFSDVFDSKVCSVSKNNRNFALANYKVKKKSSIFLTNNINVERL